MKSETLFFNPERIKPFADQPRKRFCGIAKLAESIRLVGQVTPIVVTPCSENGFDAELIDGERRLQACRLGKMQIKAIIEKNVKPADRLALSIAANFCRQSHNCIEIAEAIAQLLKQGRTREEVAGIFGKTISWIAQHVSLLTLHPGVREMLVHACDEKRDSQVRRRERGRMTLSLALLLVGLDQDRQVKLAESIVKSKMSMDCARNFVRRAATKTGKTVGKTVSARAKFMVLWNLLDGFAYRLDQFVDMPHAKLQEIVLSSNAKERQLLDRRFGELSDELAGLWTVLEKTEKENK